MAFGTKGHSRGGRPGMGGRGSMGPAPKMPTFSRPSGPARPIMGSSPAAFGAPISPVNINFNSAPKFHRSHGGGLISCLVGNAVSAGVGVASAAIVNKIHENSQMKLAEKQAEQQAMLARQQAEQQAEIARQQAEYQVELEKLKTQQEEIKLDAMQDKRYYANCPYCMGVNNGAKFCQFCGKSLAYYEENEEDKENAENPGVQNA